MQVVNKFLLYEFDGTEVNLYEEPYAELNLVNWLESSLHHKEWIDTNTSSLAIHKMYDRSQDEDLFRVTALMTESSYAEYLLIFK